MKWFERNYKDRFDFLLAYLKSGKILDVGNLGADKEGTLNTGRHELLRKYLKLNHPESELIGLDIHDLDGEQELRIKQVKGDISEPPFEDNTFDTIYMGEVIEHLKNPYETLFQVHRILKHGGKLILDTPNPYSLDRHIKWIILREESLGDPTHMLFFTPISLKTALEESGFTIDEITSDGKVSIGKGMMINKLLPEKVLRGLGSHLLASAEKRKFPA